MVKVNKARGDVLVKLGDETYVLRGTFSNLAALQSAIDVNGLGKVLELISALDARALLEGIKCLAIDGDIKAIDDLNFFDVMNDVQEAILSAITGAMGQDEGNVDSETETASQ